MNQKHRKPPENKAMDRVAFHLKAPTTPIITALWLGLVFGYLEVLQWIVHKSMIDPFSYLGPNLIWMAPLADALIFSLVGVIFAILMYLWPDRVWLYRTISICTFLGFLSLLFLSDALHPFASALLAMGLAYQTAVFLRSRLEGLLRCVRRSMGWMVFTLLGLVGVSLGWSQLEELREGSGMIPNHRNSPNVILIVMDTVRAQSLSIYGHHRSTSPNLETLSKTGILFENALSTSPWTLPAHASLFTGHYPHQLSTSWHSPLDASFPTLAEVLTHYGYRTSGFVANTTYCSYETGLDRGFAHYEDYPVSLAETFRSSSLVRRSAFHFFGLRRLIGEFNVLARKSAEEINCDFLAWLDDGVDQPFFSFLNYFDAHDPYLPPGRFGQWGPKTIEDYSLICHWWVLDKQALPEQEVNRALEAYEGCIRYLDDQIGELLASLESRGRLKDTIVIVTSDHGEAFGEHGLFGHGNCLYRPVIQVPLIIAYPAELPGGLRLRNPVSLRDIPATVLELIGAQDDHTFPGASMSRYWHFDGEFDRSTEVILSEIMSPSRIPPDQGRSPISRGPMKSFVVNGKQYIRNYGDGSEELYDFAGDCELSQVEDIQEQLGQSRQTLEQFLSKSRLNEASLAK